MRFEKEREIALAAVLKASSLCQSVQHTLVSDESMAKKDKSPVTVADFGAQAVVNLALLDAFPNDPIVGEEDATHLRSEEGEDLKSKVVEHALKQQPGRTPEDILNAIDHGTYEGGATGRHWVLDPIDGTKGFLRGDQYAVALGLIENGVVVLGILGCPHLPMPNGGRGGIFIASQGQGTTVRTLDNATETTVKVTGITDPSQAAFCESVESGHSSHGDAARIAETLKITTEPYRIDSQCKYAAIARGDASIYLRLPTRADYEEKIWDHAAGWMVVTEAGGKVTDVRGKELDFSLGRTLNNNLGVIATNGKLHGPVVDAVQSVLGL